MSQVDDFVGIYTPSEMLFCSSCADDFWLPENGEDLVSSKDKRKYWTCDHCRYDLRYCAIGSCNGCPGEGCVCPCHK